MPGLPFDPFRLFGFGEQFTDLVQSIPGYINDFMGWANGVYARYSDVFQNNTVQAYMNEALSSMGSAASDVARQSATGVVAIGAGVVLVFLMEMLNRSIRRPVDLTNRLGIQPFATLPYIRTREEIRWKRGVIGGVLVSILAAIPLVLYFLLTPPADAPDPAGTPPATTLPAPKPKPRRRTTDSRWSPRLAKSKAPCSALRPRGSRTTA